MAKRIDEVKRDSGRGGSLVRRRGGEFDAPRREQEVLDAATKIFYNQGYADASVQDIANELGILKGSLYHYINSKEDLLYRILEETHSDVAAILESVEQMETDNPVERLREYFARQAAYTAKNLAKMSVYYHDLDQLSESRRKDLNRQRRTHERFVVSLIEEAQRRGEADKNLDPRLMVNYLFGSLIWIYRWYRPGGKLSADQVSTGLADFVSRSLLNGQV